MDPSLPMHSLRAAVPRDSARKCLLVISAGVEAVPGIARIKRLGHWVVASDGNPKAPGFALADDAILASTYDAAGTAQAAEVYSRTRRPIDGVMSIAADVPLTVATVAAHLRLPGLTLETARLATDKLAMKERFRAEGIPVPWFAPVQSGRELARLMRLRRHVLVLKPVDSRGARGVLRLVPGTDPEWAFAVAMEHSRSRQVMVEEFVPGPQLSTESMIWNGRSYTAGCSDRNYEHLQRYAPFVIENGGCQPSAHLSEVIAQVDALVLRAARAIGLERGVLKGDLVLDPEGGLVVIEVAPRLSGGWFATDQIPHSTGVDLVEAQARIALGAELDPETLTPRRFDPIAVRYFFPPPGVVRAIHGVEELRREAWISRLVILVAPGDELALPTDHTKRAGLVLATGSTRAQAIARAEDAVRRVRFEIDGARSGAA